MNRTRNGAKSPRARALGSALAEARHAAGLTQRATASRLGVHHTRIARAETGAHPPSSEDTASILALFGITGAHRDEILEMARDIDRGNWTVTGAGVPSALTTLVDYEREATAITVSTPLLVPGLLQTMSYARAIISAGDATPEEIEARTMYRMGRQEILRAATAPRFMSIFHEWALQSPVGGHAAMAEQMKRLLSWIEHDHISVQVVPSSIGPSVSSSGNFSIYEFDRSPPIVHLEHLSASTFVDDARHIANFLAAREIVLKEAMSPEESIKLITDVYLPHHQERQDR
ncbi:helix-turn-helix domain-containing protein [Actinoalloteichus hymeniacidonis]|uniref:DNA binding protein with helix-turn-helix domain n=1 Tax=Actinoalloteichus hymeniacidonis TaxID=340345 RepID=A0AAC9MX98_9PSEU|nr:helix-turn-helix transcriptional regulator [Actinoalloteichus hymeniacidonis]AOS62054.1 DNA binding protein with helix-turn-helix domain [Actinoalloteichus hymeniacidonis]MBB5909924.1 transcriptional regulator with XRE-family HTH domain [Actinoalloteichus hymeniacidonis]